MKTIITSLLLFFWLLASGNAAPPLPARLEATVNLSSGVVVRVSIITISFSSTTPKIVAMRWGADDSPKLEPPQRIISAMDIYLGNEKLQIPLSAFGDLCDPDILTVKATKRGFEVKIKGSDAGGAYEARLVFEGNLIRRRRVIDLEFPDEVWEETTYKFNTGNY